MDTTMTCRCCLLRPPDKDLKTSYIRLGKSEVFADMLKECFEIHLSLSGGGICEICINRLRDASDFKLQVLQCQAELQDKQVELFKAETKVKEEISDISGDNGVFFLDLKEELEYPYAEPSDSDDAKLAELLNLGSRRKRKHRSKNDRKLRSKAPLKLSLRPLRKITELPPLSLVTDNSKHRQNIHNILRHSTCVPFLNKTLAGVVCAFCRQTCPDLSQLRDHIAGHHPDRKLLLDKRLDKNNLSVKLDITDLRCTICDAKVELIANLKTHLGEKHDVKFFPDVNDYVLEFKLTEGVLNCALCHSTFETFKMLLQHMNGHYRNYICEVCDMGFINLHRLKNHQRTHEIGTYNCSFCDKVFSTRVRKMCHEKYTHNTSARYTTSCPHCDQSFTSYYQRNRHMFTEHDAAAATYKCNICDKSFILKSKLTSHIKKVHLMERNHICAECGQGFFIKQSLDEHMIKHNGERVFSCTVCHKAYARKKTLREHMRIHNNDRRFKCGVCALAFVQKCSLKSHMLSNHGIALAEYESSRSDLCSP